MPHMYGLLRKNAIANPEKHLVELIDELLINLEKLAKDGQPVKDKLSPNTNLNKVSVPISGSEQFRGLKSKMLEGAIRTPDDYRRFASETSGMKRCIRAEQN